MAVYKVTVELCAGGDIRDDLQAMIDISERCKCEVEASVNGITMTLGPSRIDDVLRIWDMKLAEERRIRETAVRRPSSSDGCDGCC